MLRNPGIPGSGDVEKFAQTRYTGVWRRFKGCKIPVYRRPASKGLTHYSHCMFDDDVTY